MDVAERIIKGIYQKGMLDYEQICERVLVEMEKNGCGIRDITQLVLDKAQAIFEEENLK